MSRLEIVLGERRGRTKWMGDAGGEKWCRWAVGDGDGESDDDKEGRRELRAS